MGADTAGEPPANEVARHAVRVTPDALRRIRAGHPWVFDRSVVSGGDGAVAGDLAVVFDERRRFAAIGLWDPDSPIRIKVLHTGRPVSVDAEFWRSRVAAAWDRRAELNSDPRTTGYRVVHGENDALPGLVVDRYGDAAVAKVYSAAWWPHLHQVAAAITEVVGCSTLVLRVSRSLRATAPMPDGTALVGVAPEGPVEFHEAGLRFLADLATGQKTGHFLDQRENRIRVAESCPGARVLDVFASTGGFSVHALAAGARSVHLVDLSPAALATAERNLALNGLNGRHRVTQGDAFEAMEAMRAARDRYDVVVIDPPSFAQRQDSVRGALSAYARLTALGVGLVRSGGLLVQASCSARVAADAFFRNVAAAAAEQRVEFVELARTGHPADHPIGFPEGAYLKAIYARVERGTRRGRG